MAVQSINDLEIFVSKQNFVRTVYFLDLKLVKMSKVPSTLKSVPTHVKSNLKVSESIFH